MTIAGANPELRAAREIVARLSDLETGDRCERWVERARVQAAGAPRGRLT